MIPIIDMISRPNRSEMGRIGERYAATLFLKSGYVPLPRRRLHGDLGVLDPLDGTIRSIEVKTSRRRPDGKYVFQLLNDSQNCTRADFVLLLCVQKSGIPVPFLIPVQQNRRTLVITSYPQKYHGRWAVYRQSGALDL